MLAFVIVAPLVGSRLVGIPPVADVWQTTIAQISTPSLNPRIFVVVTSQTLQGDHLPLKEVLNEFTAPWQAKSLQFGRLTS